jgi:hypothetical protein
MRSGRTPISDISVSRVKSLLASTASAWRNAKLIAWNLRPRPQPVSSSPCA